MNLPQEVIDTAQRHAKIALEVCISPDIAVCLDEMNRYRYYSADAWTPPTEMPLLPWSPPRHQPIASVTPDGVVTYLSQKA